MRTHRLPFIEQGREWNSPNYPRFLVKKGIQTHRLGNNIWAKINILIRISLLFY